ncbi:metacaspase-1-like isoform X2 [Beta vulgaris subsp. vulgaris]|uniref:metacaspase-1-like isoform X2 n=1 Tax=Beta vulgaris subsp. vulgaris TaxID=3555 RepID=UPI002036FF1B|nr:metacaspase-1-like isoform X2 [Beta vulgaris subsp. vulgaris]
MSYSTVSHVAHDSYPQQGGYPGPGFEQGYGPPHPPPRPGFEQGYASGPGPGYQGYLSDNYPPQPQVAHVQHSGPTHPFHQQPYSYQNDYPYDSGCSSLFRAWSQI